MKLQNNVMNARLGLKSRYAIRVMVWIALVATVAVWQLYIPKVKMDTGIGTVTWSLNGVFRGLFLISPWVGFICSAAGQMNVLPLVWANPVFLLTPTIYATLGVLFHKLSKKIGKGFVRDILMLLLFGMVQGVIVTFNSALTNSLTTWSLVPFTKTLSQLTFGIVALRAFCNGLLYCATYPLVLFIRKMCGNNDPFKMPLLYGKGR